MKKNNKEGFTLIEVLIVVLILAILIIIATVAITRYVTGGKDTYNDKLKDELRLAGKAYYTENKDKLPTKSSNRTYDYVTLADLKDGRFLTNELVDSEGRDCSDSYVYVRQKGYNKTDYEYVACLICKDAKGKIYTYDKKDDPHCNIDKWSDTVAPTCTNKIINDYDDDPATNWTLSDVNDDQGLKYIIIREKKNYKNYYVIEVKDRAIEEIRAINIKDVFKSKFNTNLDADYEVIAIDEGGNESTNSCLDFSIIHDSCYMDWSGSNVIIKSATSKRGFKAVYYKVGNNAPVAKELISGHKITNKSISGIPVDADVLLQDEKNNMIPCDTTGMPVCSFTQAPSSTKYIGPSGTNLKVKCKILDDGGKKTKVLIKDLSKIVTDTSKGLGTITTKNITHNGGSEKKAVELELTIPYKPNDGKTGTETITFGAGVVRNAKSGYENKVNRAISTTFMVDTIKPTITYDVLGEEGKATAVGDSGKGYYNSVSVTVGCSDKVSGVDIFKINGSKTSNPYVIPLETRGSIPEIKADCTDKAGNSSTKKGGPYRVLKQITDCNICGVSTYKSCPSKAECGCK